MYVRRKVPPSLSLAPNPSTPPAPHRALSLSASSSPSTHTVFPCPSPHTWYPRTWRPLSLWDRLWPGLGSSASRRGLGEGGEQGRGCSQCYFELLTEQHRRGDSLLLVAPGQAMRVSVPLTPHPGYVPGSSCRFLISERRGLFVISPDVAEGGGGREVPWSPSLSFLVGRESFSSGSLPTPQTQGPPGPDS